MSGGTRAKCLTAPARVQPTLQETWDTGMLQTPLPRGVKE